MSVSPVSESLPDWLHPSLITYHRLQRAFIRAQLWKSAVYATLLAAAANIAFLMIRTPSHQDAWLIASLTVSAIALPQLPFAVVATRRAQQRRLAVVQRFFSVGLRLDADGRLLQNRANGAIVLDLAAAQTRPDPAEGIALPPKPA